MASCDCPICYDKISAATGVTTLSCSHSFHLSCISGWFLQQEAGTCPCCRKEMAAIEDLPRDDELSDVSSDDSDDDDEVEFTRASLQAFMRSLGGNLTDAAAENICDIIAGFTYYELNALVVGNTGRQLTEDQWNDLLEDDDSDSGDELEDGEIDDDSPMTVDNMRITSSLNIDGSWSRVVTRSLSREHDKAATKLQAFWRGFQGRVIFIERSAARILATMA